MMLQFRTVCLSAHLDSFCRKLDELCGLEFVYKFGDPGEERRRVGWSMTASYRNGPITPENTKRAESCELVYDMLREFDLFETRARKGLKTIYASERWLKPIVIGSKEWGVGSRGWKIGIRLGWARGIRLPGVLRLLVPSYRRMAQRFAKLMDDPNFYVFPIGVPAARDMVRIYRILHGDWKSFFREPKVEIERKLGGSVVGFPRMHLWAYFVEPSKVGVRDEGVGKRKEELGKREEGVESRGTGEFLKILWVGRMLDWKRVDTLIKAFKIVVKQRPAALLLVGEGPERSYLERMAGKELGIRKEESGRRGEVAESELGWVEGKIVFHDYIKNDEVRRLMREASVYVMPSNAEEGWGAAVSDALSEGCPVFSTFEAGSSATLLPDENLFCADNVGELALRIVSFTGEMVKYEQKGWDGKAAAEKLLEIVK